jgi:hypothetical protein
LENIINIQKTVVLHGILYGSETWSLILRQEHRMKVFENRVLRRIFGPKEDEVTGGGEYFLTRNFVICTLHEVLLKL